MFDVNTPSKDSLDGEDPLSQVNEELIDTFGEVMVAGGSDCEETLDAVVTDKKISLMKPDNSSDAETGVTDKRISLMKPDNSDAETVAEDEGIMIWRDEEARGNGMEEVEDFEIAPRSSDDSPGEYYSCIGEAGQSASTFTATSDDSRVLWSEETMSERSRLSSIRRAYAGRSSASSRHLSLHPNATWREGFSTPAAASLGASQVNMFGTTSPESPDALSSWYMTKQAGKRKTNGDGVSAAAPARHESRFPRKRLHVGKEMKPGASVYPGLTKPLRENETPLDWRDGVDSDDDYVCEKFFRRIGVTNKKELERVLKKIMKSSGAKGKGSKTPGSRCEHGRVTTFMVPLSWGFLGGNKKGLSPSSNTYVAVAHKLSFSFSEPMSDTEFVAWLRKAITPARSRMMTAGRQAVSTLVCTLIDRVEEVITVDLEISPSDMPTIMDEVWSEVLKALLQLPVTDEVLRPFYNKLFGHFVNAHRGRTRGATNPLSLADILGETNLFHDLRRNVMVPMVLNAVTCIRDMPVSPVLYDPFAECRKQAEDWVPVPIGGFPSTNSLETVYRDGMWKSLFRFFLSKNRPAHILNDMQPWEVTEATARKVLMPYVMKGKEDLGSGEQDYGFPSI